MTQQLDLFADPAPVVVGHAQARKSDPATSHQAIAEHEASGKAESHRQRILENIKVVEGRTFGEIAVAVRLDAVEVMRRLNDLRKAGEIQKGYARVCRVKGTHCLTWWLV